jgi:prepilin-type N-terminal cleavage/methylation domain-containing protein
MTIKKGFTLIELLVVIGIMAVLAAGVVALINPLEKTRQANDANVQNGVGQVATSLQSYAAQQTTGIYPTTAQGLAHLVTTGELTALPAGVAFNYAGVGTTAVVSASLASAKYIQGSCAGVAAWWFWSSQNGRACGFCGAGAPVLGSACAF